MEKSGMKAFSKEKQLFVNLISSVVVLLTELSINFFLSPYIVKNIGVEANGYVQLANNFVTYATLLVTVVNSMAGRFITIEYHKGNVKKASIYYTSVFFADLVLCTLFIVPVIFCLYNLESIISVPAELLMDVKLAFFFVFLNFLAGLVLPMWGTATYITNKLYITSIGKILSTLLRIAMIISAFVIFVPKIWYIALASFIAAFFLKIWNFIHKRRLLPDLKVSPKLFNFNAIAELMAAGIWNAISSLGNTLISGLDLLICNIFVGSIEMGILSLAKTLPHILQSLNTSIVNVFAPSMTINYAKGNMEELKKDLKQAMNITGIILTVPLSMLFVFGDDFFLLWVPSQNAKVLQILSCLTIFSMIFTSGIQALYNAFVTANKVKINSLVMLLTGALNTVIVFICLKTTGLGVFAVAGVSSVLNLIRNMTYTVPFASKYLGFKWYTFYPQVGKSVISVIVALLIGYVIGLFIPAGNSWLLLVIACAIFSIIVLSVNIAVVLNKNERAVLKNMVLKKLKRNGKSE